MFYKTCFFSTSIDIFIIAPNLQNVVFKNSSVIELLPPTNMVIPLRDGSEIDSGELEVVAAAAALVVGGVVLEVEETKLLYKFCKHIKYFFHYLLKMILCYYNYRKFCS